VKENKPASMAVLVITNLGNNKFHWSFQNDAVLGFPVASSTQSGLPVSKQHLKDAFARMIDECMP
jgi:hypothetical protein